MAIPSTTYDIATISNPTSALTDFTLIVDLSNMSASWWAAVDTAYGTKGRASKSDGLTELACDFIDFDSTLETGILRVKYTGTLASTGTQQIRVYPPNNANTSYLATDTYGQYNAYDSNWLWYTPDGGSVNRVNTAYSVSQVGTITAGDASGKLGKATTFDGSNGWGFGVSGPTISKSELFIGAIYNQTTTFPQSLFSRKYSGSWQFTFSTNNYYTRDSSTGSSGGRNNDLSWTNPGSGDYRHLYTRYSVNNSIKDIYIDGSVLASTSTSVDQLTAESTSEQIGYDAGEINGFDGTLEQFFIQSYRVDSWRDSEYSQTNDNATFWGTWTNVPVGTQEVILNPVINETETITASLLSGKSIIATINEPESITSQLLIDKLISAVVNEPESITAILLTESTVNEVVLTPIVNESENVTALLLSAKELFPTINEPETITATLKNRLPLFPEINESENVTATLLVSSPTTGTMKIFMEMSKDEISAVMTKPEISMNIKIPEITMEMQS